MRKLFKRAVEVLAHQLPTAAASKTPRTSIPDWAHEAAELFFDAEFYAKRYPDVAGFPGGLKQHYLLHGIEEGRQPHALIDPHHVLAQCPELGNVVEALRQICLGTHKTSVNPHPLFDVTYYVQRCPEALGHDHPLLHYMRHPASDISPCPLFDSTWYRQKYDAPNDSPALLHYLAHAHEHAPHPLFDPAHYVAQRPDAQAEPLVHMVRHYGLSCANPHPLFDVPYYVGQCSEAHTCNPLLHYVTKNGERQSPHPLFDEVFYRERYMAPDDPRRALEHYLVEGVADANSPCPLFDGKYYQSQLTHEVPEPLQHFLNSLWEDCASPHPLFDCVYYRNQVEPDVSDNNPLLHYLTNPHLRPHPLFWPDLYGANAGRPIVGNPLAHYLTSQDSALINPHPLFDAKFYVKRYGLDTRVMKPLEHFVRWCVLHGFNPNGYFDVAFYIAENPDINFSSLNPLVHYESVGEAQGRNPSRIFDLRYYRSMYPDVGGNGLNPLHHFLQYGLREGRRPHGGLDALYNPAPSPPPPSPWLPSIAPSWEMWSQLQQKLKTSPCVDGIQVNVIVPVYSGYDESLLCIFSVLRSRLACQTSFQCVVIDDAAPDHRLAAALRKLADWGLIYLARNPVNVGFVRTVNYGMGLDPQSDVVLLNADTEVYGNWLDRLRRAAHSGQRVGTITPLSNNATICSYPSFAQDNAEPLEITYEALDARAAAVNAGMRVPIPTAVGFCMYIRRACLDEVGIFDADTYGRGYAEENDFCLRATERAWQHLLVCDTFVFHRGSVSFLGEKDGLINKNLRLLEQKFPHYPQAVMSFLQADPVKRARRRLDLDRLRQSTKSSRGVVIMVNHARGGGTERHMLDMSAWLQSEGYGVCFLRPHPTSRTELQLNTYEPLQLPNLEAFSLTAGLEEAVAILSELGAVLLHVHHLADLDETAPDWLRALAMATNLPFDVTLHDYTALCPRINMIDETETYCGEPPVVRCESCVANYNSSFGHLPVWRWRDRYQRFLNAARNIYVPSCDVAARMRRHYPEANYVLRPHTEEIDAGSRRVFSEPGPILRVAVLGAIGPHKGSRLLRQCVIDAQARNLAMEFILFGYSDLPELLNMPKITVTGAYEEMNIYSLLADNPCDIAFFPAVWPETYSYTLSIAINAGLHPVSFNFGAIAERVEALKWGTLIPLDKLDDPRGVNDFLLEREYELLPDASFHSNRDILYPGGIDDYYTFVPRRHSDEILGVTESQQVRVVIP